MLEKRQEKIHVFFLFSNPSIFELDYTAIGRRIASLKEELIAAASHPRRIQRLMDMGVDIDDRDNYM
jgi:hypothetical protein